MADKIYENNQVIVAGEIISRFQYSHEVFGENFYMVDIAVKRFSGFSDFVPLILSEQLIDARQDYSGQLIRVSGQFRSYNRHDGKKTKLILAVFAQELEFLTEMPKGDESNLIFLDGYICKDPIYRKTPLKREITDLLIAVNRSYGKSDYIPSICWGRNARDASTFEIGSHVQLLGRIQSREYLKRTEEGEAQKRIAYEVSISKMEYLE